ncbi:MAG: Ppx/GppA phosphatase family protein [Parachlamydiales bacterium]
MRWLLLTLLLFSAAPSPTLHRRLAIDVGTSSIKVRIADVAEPGRRLSRTVFQNSYPIPLQEEIESSGTHELSKKVKTEVRNVVAQSVQLARSLGAKEIAAVATIALENAKNHAALIDDVEKATGVRLTFVTPEEEAAIGFEGAASVSGRSRYDLVVWDIGGETSEIATLNRRGGYERWESDVASTTFANLVLSEVKRANPNVVTTPNPLSKEQIDAAVKLAADRVQEISPAIRQKISGYNSSVMGIGAIAFLALDSLGPTHTFDEIKSSLYAKADLKDSQFLSPFPQHMVTNLALVVGIMEALDIRQITLEVADLTTGLVLMPQYLKPLPATAP